MLIFDYVNGIRGGITRSIYHYGDTNNKYLFNYEETLSVH